MNDALARHKAWLRSKRCQWIRELYSPDPVTRAVASQMLEAVKEER